MVTFTLSCCGGMELSSGSSRVSSGRTNAVSTSVSHRVSCKMCPASLACPTEEGTLITVILGLGSPWGSIGNACGNSVTFLRINSEALLAGSLISALTKSQTNWARPASRMRASSRRSHSVRALSPTNTNCVVSGNTGESKSTAGIPPFRASARLRYTMPSYAMPFSCKRDRNWV